MLLHPFQISFSVVKVDHDRVTYHDVSSRSPNLNCRLPKYWACLVEGVTVSLQQTNTKLTQKIQAYVLVWC
jgi:hypothetical protein